MQATNKIRKTERQQMSSEDRAAEFLSTTYIVLHFVPIIASICWIIYFACGQGDALAQVLSPILLVGYAGVVLTRPFKTIVWALKIVGRATFGTLCNVMFPVNLVAAVFAFLFSLLFVMGVVFFVPAALTLYFLFVDED